MKRSMALLAILFVAGCGYIPRSADNIAPESPTPPAYFTPYESPDASSTPTDAPASPAAAQQAAPPPNAPAQPAPAPPPAPAPAPTPYVVRIVIHSTLYSSSSATPNGGFAVAVQAFYSDGSDHGNGAVLGACGQVVTGTNTYSGCTAPPPAWTYRNAYLFAGQFASAGETMTSVTMTYKGVSATCTPPCGV